jgi:hypothetical protein
MLLPIIECDYYKMELFNMKILKLTEYTDMVGFHHIQSDDLVGTGLNWIVPARVLSLDVPTFLMMLKKDYEAIITIYKNDDDSVKFVGFKWRDLAMARKYKNYVNRIAREKRITLEGISNGKI